ncbi:MAG: histidine phosphatase family protein, partial [Actinomycetota bacterium]
MDLFLVRHGQPDLAPDRIARNDPVLTELGREQARRVGHRFATVEEVDELWSSPMNRAVETSAPVSEG